MEMNLPLEYQQQIEAALRKKKLAEMLQQRAMNNNAPAPMGPVAVKQSKFGSIANVLSSIGGAYMGGKADDEVNNVRKQYGQDEAADMAALTAMAEPDAIKAGQNSKFSRSRTLAETMQKQAEKRRELKSGVYKDAGQIDNALSTLDGTPMGEQKPQPQPSVEWIKSPDGKSIPKVTNLDKYGRPTISLGAQGTTNEVKNILPAEQGKLANGLIGETLKERRTKATSAQELYGSTNYALDALESGAKAGGGQPTMQVLRKALQALKIEVPETAGTEQLQQALLKGVLDNAAKLRPASDTDLIILQKMAGDVGTDPNALVRSLAHAQAMSIKDLQGYNGYVQENQKNIVPEIQALFAGATSGYEPPSTLQGPPAFQMEVMRQMQRQRVDITKFLDPEGKPFAANSKFTIDPKVGMPGIETNKPTPKPEAPLSPEELKRYELLKKKHGR